jgi:hypothetical protein
MNISFSGQQFSGLLIFVPLAYFLAVALVHTGFAAAVFHDAARLRKEGTGPLIGGPFLWTLATLLGGVFVAAIYWLVNHSTLSRRL